MSKTTQNNSAQNSLEATRTIPNNLSGFNLSLDSISTITDERFILSFDGAGRPSITGVPDDACVMSTRQLLTAINEPNGIYIDTPDLVDFAVATIKRLKSRRNYYQTKGDTVRSETTDKAMEALAGELL